MDFSNLIVSYLDVEANKSVICKELSEKLNVPVSDISVYYESEYDGAVHQYIDVSVSGKIPKDTLMKLDFDYLEDGFIRFKVGDIIL